MSIDIFGGGSSRKRRKSRSKSLVNRDDEGRRNRDRLHPMAFSMLIIKTNALSKEDRPSNWFVKTLSLISDEPWSLTDKWIDKVNEITEGWIKSASLEEPDIAEGHRGELGPFRVYKIIPAKDTAEYPTPAIMAVDDRGWKWYFKTTKAYSFSEDDVIILTATISGYGEGISFLRRPHNIRLFEVGGDDDR